ncbi:uncharacterized protein LOC129273405 [Lytechinus pictus]|uniref:uncharacterized protein LOC129273405 n=1 Tax=Lytechinus pictus TaxID=7653 RepID=UPI0030B9FADE
MASHQLILRYDPLRRHTQDETMTTALPPISNSSNEHNEIKGEETHRRHRRLTSIKDFVKKQKRSKQRTSNPVTDRENTNGNNSSVVVQEIRPSSAGLQTASSRPRKYVSKRNTNSKVEQRLVRAKSSGSKRMSYPPSEFHRQELVSSSFARLRRDSSKSCPMLCDCAMYEFDDEGGVTHLSQNSVDKFPPHENGIDRNKSSDRTNCDRFRVRTKSKSSKKDDIISVRPPKPPSWQNLQTPSQQNLSEPEVKSNPKPSHASEMLKKIGRSKSEEIGMQRHDRIQESMSYRPSKAPSWQTVATQGGSYDADGNVESTSRWSGFATSEGAGNHRQLEPSYKPPKPPSWQTVPAAPEEVTIDTKQTENIVPTIIVPSNPSGRSEARADGRCTSAGSSRSTRSPAKVQGDDDVDNDDSNSPDTVQASATNKSRGLRRSNIKRTRSRMIDAREIPKQDSVIPLSQTKPSEFHLRETHHDNDVYLSENVERCRQWLAGLLGDEGDTLAKTSSRSHRGAAARYDESDDDDDELVTCDLELSRDKWMYVGSPYPSSSSEDGDD